MGKILLSIAVLLALLTVSKACFPSKYWISCLIDTCKLGGSCPGDPTAMCRMDKTDCDGCHAVWYNEFGERANCSAKRDLQLCPGGEPVVHCKVDPCQWSCDHPSFKNAPCQKKYCGQCAAEYLVDGVWSQCPSTSPSDAGAMLPIDTVINPRTIVGECRMVPCSIEVCINQRCPAIKSAVCRPYACNECKPMWYLGNTPVDCQTGDFIKGLPQIQQPIVQPLDPNVSPFQRTCKPGESHVPCDFRSACDGEICRNYPNAVCRPDGCGTCKPTWYLEDKLVDCLSDQCPPNVPFVRCVDDPCKYFSHYCPTAECRASQCGKCEAKFYVNGNEIDCVMPPKTCQVGVDPRSCPWYTCPANICPSNSRLMCRINPCGTQCTHEWVDIYNGELRTCRTFDKEQSPTKQSTYQRPESNKIFFKDPILNIIDPNYSDAPLYEEKTANAKVKPKEIIASRIPRNSHPTLKNMPPASGEFVQQKQSSGGFKVDPLFVNPGAPIKDADILSLLRAFPYEFSVVSSSAIKNALKKPVPTIDRMGMSTGQLLDQTPIIPQAKQTSAGLIDQTGVTTGAVIDKTPIIPRVKQQAVVGTFDQTAMSSGPVLDQVPLPKQPFFGPADQTGMSTGPVLDQMTKTFVGSSPSQGFRQDLTNLNLKPMPSLQQDVMPQMQQDFSQNLNTNLPSDTGIDANLASELNPVQPEIPIMPLSNAPVPKANLQTVQTVPKPMLPKTIELKPVSQPSAPMTNPMETLAANTQTFEQAMALLRELTNKASSADIAQTLAGAAPTLIEQPPVEPLYPEMQQTVTNSQPALFNEPANQGLISNQADIVKPKPKKSVNPVSQNNGGLPISMNLFSQWSNMPL